MNFHFKLGAIPVQVHGSFLLVVALLGWQPHDLAGIAQWMAVVFVGVLLHELGHALVGRSFGLTPKIDLVGFGGLTSWSAGPAGALPAAKRIAISLAGPFTGIAIGLATMVLVRARAGVPPLAIFDHETPWGSLTRTVFFVNFWWGALNLLPILPLDGGNVLLQSLNWLTRGGGEKPARIVSAVVAVLGGLYAFFVQGSTYAAILAALFAAQNVQAIRAAAAAHAEERDRPA
jgi:stage IV sporulation protein FB